MRSVIAFEDKIIRFYPFENNSYVNEIKTYKNYSWIYDNDTSEIL